MDQQELHEMKRRVDIVIDNDEGQPEGYLVTVHVASLDALIREHKSLEERVAQLEEALQDAEGMLLQIADQPTPFPPSRVANLRSFLRRNRTVLTPTEGEEE